MERKHNDDARKEQSRHLSIKPRVVQEELLDCLHQMITDTGTLNLTKLLELAAEHGTTEQLPRCA